MKVLDYEGEGNLKGKRVGWKRGIYPDRHVELDVISTTVEVNTEFPKDVAKRPKVDNWAGLPFEFF